MEEYKKHFINEYNEPKERTTKLETLIYKKHWHNTLDFNPICPMDLLEKQFKTMKTYLSILERRAEIEHIDIQK